MEQSLFSVLVLAYNPYSRLVPLVRGGEGHRLHEDLWRLPGGCCLVGELPKKTAEREMLEETGITVKNLQYIHTVTKRFPNAKEIHEQFVYLASFHSIENVLKRGNEGEIVELFSVDRFPSKMDMYAPHQAIFEKVIAKLSAKQS